MKSLFKYASLLVAAAMLFACEGTIDNSGQGGDETGAGKVLKITADKNLVHTFDGDFTTITVTLDDEVITDGVTFYNEKMAVLDIKDFKFSTTTPGEHTIIASYGTFNTKDNPLKIMAVSVKIPENPADPYQNRTDFKARVLVVEHTGTGCMYCPPMKTLIHEALSDKAFAERVVLTTCHTYNDSDPAYFNEMDYKNFNFGGESLGHPYVYIDSYSPFTDHGLPSAAFKSQVNALYDAKKDVAAGIAVKSVLSGDQLVVKAAVKSAETATYRVGAYLLEDGIKGTQHSATADWMHIHDGVISHVDAKYYASGIRYYGHSLGEIKRGETGDYLFVWDLAQIQDERQAGCSRKDFVRDNLRLAVFVTTIGKDANGKEFYYVNNVVEAPLTGEKPYDYK